MAITLDGTNGITSPDFEPSSSTTPTNGLFLPAANTVGLATGSTERLRIDSSGNLGLGVTPSAWGSFKALQLPNGTCLAGYTVAGIPATWLTAGAYYDGSNWIYTNSSVGVCGYRQNAAQHSWFVANSGTAGNAISFTQAMTLDASGNLVVGATSSGYRFQATKNGAASVSAASSDTQATVRAECGSYVIDLNATTSVAELRTATNVPLIFSVNSSERARIDSSGNLLVGNTSAPGAASKAFIFNAGGVSQNCLFLQNNANFTGVQGAYIYNANVFNDTGHQFLYCTDGTLRAEIRSNGGLANYSANNVNLSDERVKTDITPAPSWLTKINAIEVVNFKYKDQTFDEPNLGVIAQQVLSVAPELVDEDGFGETPEDGVPLMAIFETDLKYAMLKAIQELTARLEALENK